MFFVASKVFWMFLSPIVVLLVLALVGASWSGDRWRRTFRSIGIAAILILITVAMTPLGLMAAAPLENRFPQPAADMPPPFGIIVLGGAVNGPVSKARGEIVFDEGERMIEAAFLAKRYPQARVVFTGGSGSLIAEFEGGAGRSRASHRARRRSGPHHCGGQVAQHGGECAIYGCDCAPRTQAAVATGHLGLSYAPCDWGVRESRIRRGRRSGCLSNAWTGKRVAMGLGPWKRISDFRDRGARMDRPRRIPGNRKDR